MFNLGSSQLYEESQNPIQNLIYVSSIYYRVMSSYPVLFSHPDIELILAVFETLSVFVKYNWYHNKLPYDAWKLGATYE